MAGHTDEHLRLERKSCIVLRAAHARVLSRAVQDGKDGERVQSVTAW